MHMESGLIYNQTSAHRFSVDALPKRLRYLSISVLRLMTGFKYLLIYLGSFQIGPSR